MGGDGILLGMEANGELRLIVEFDRRYFQAGQGEWNVMVRNDRNQWVYPLVPTARGRTKLGRILRKRN